MSTFDFFNDALVDLSARIGEPCLDSFMAGVACSIWDSGCPARSPSSLCLEAGDNGTDLVATVGDVQRVWLLDGVLPGEALPVVTLDAALPEALAWIADGLAAL